MDKYYFLKNNMKEVEKVVNFFLCSIIDPKEYENIKPYFLEKRPDDYLTRMGMFTKSDFFIYNAEKKGYSSFELSTVNNTIELLCLKSFLFERTTNLNSSDPFSNYRYSINKDFAKFCFENDLIYNILFGFSYILKKYSESVLLIEHITQDDDYTNGTGFCIGLKDNKNQIINLAITNNHVVDNAKQLTIYNSKREQINHSDVIQSNNKLDIAAIVLEGDINYPCFSFSDEASILDEIITIGYPTVPMTNNAYQLAHKGEINSFVADHLGNEYFLFSAKTTGGNSGGPIIDNTGRVVGIVAQDFFEKYAFENKGKLPYYAGISSKYIAGFINTIVIPILVKKGKVAFS